MPASRTRRPLWYGYCPCPCSPSAGQEPCRGQCLLCVYVDPGKNVPRNETFFSLADAKEAVSEKLELNGYSFKKREGNRRDAYIHEEKEFMQPLPVNPYEPSLWSDQTVLLDYTVTDGLNKYSVPYDLIGEAVSVRVTHDTVEVFFHGNRVAVHPREVSRKRDPVMITSHMPENHRQILPTRKMISSPGLPRSAPILKKSSVFSWNPERLLSRALSLVPA